MESTCRVHGRQVRPGASLRERPSVRGFDLITKDRGNPFALDRLNFTPDNLPTCSVVPRLPIPAEPSITTRSAVGVIDLSRDTAIRQPDSRPAHCVGNEDIFGR